jgi:hypothetical protein
MPLSSWKRWNMPADATSHDVRAIHRHVVGAMISVVVPSLEYLRESCAASPILPCLRPTHSQSEITQAAFPHPPRQTKLTRSWCVG